MTTKYTIFPKKIGDSWYVLIPNDFIKFGQVDPDKEQNILIEEVK